LDDKILTAHTNRRHAVLSLVSFAFGHGSELPKLEADLARMKIDQVSVEEVIFEARNLEPK